MSEHTPGPWTFKPHEMGTFVRCEKGYIISGPVNERPGHEANARLIAAAPDLLEALKNVCTQLLGWGVSTDPEHPDRVALRNAEAAIDKATGGQA